jgi:hypothetical protein
MDSGVRGRVHVSVIKSSAKLTDRRGSSSNDSRSSSTVSSLNNEHVETVMSSSNEDVGAIPQNFCGAASSLRSIRPWSRFDLYACCRWDASASLTIDVDGGVDKGPVTLSSACSCTSIVIVDVRVGCDRVFCETAGAVGDSCRRRQREQRGERKRDAKQNYVGDVVNPYRRY